MTRKFNVNIYTQAYATVEVEITDEELSNQAIIFEVLEKDLTIIDLIDVIFDKYSEIEPPTLCAQCSGYGQRYSLELNNEWTVSCPESQAIKEIT